MNRSTTLCIITTALLGTVSLAFGGFAEDFSAGLGHWYQVVYDSYPGSEVDPPPVIDPAMGLEAPSLDVNGNGWCGNGAHSVESFDSSKGLNVEWDMYVASGYDWNWAHAGISSHLPNLSLPRADGAYIDDTRCDPEHLVGIGIKGDGPVDSFIDGALKYSTVKTINTTSWPLPLLFGGRDADGPVRMDNVQVTSAVVAVTVDIKPGSEPNCINNNGLGAIPVAILGSAGFDVRTIDPGSVMLEGLGVKVVGKSNRLLAHYEDVSGDGIEDLVVQIQNADGAFALGASSAAVTGVLVDGTPIAGTDSLCLVP